MDMLQGVIAVLLLVVFLPIAVLWFIGWWVGTILGGVEEWAWTLKGVLLTLVMLGWWLARPREFYHGGWPVVNWYYNVAVIGWGVFGAAVIVFFVRAVRTPYTYVKM